jgi:hypothetical protein
MILVAVLSLAVLFLFAPARPLKINWQMFFLGAGFMLLETKGVVHMALLFGSTWIVNSIVFAAILVMILFSNLFVLKVQPRKTGLYYGLLAAALLVNIIVPMNVFWPCRERPRLSCRARLSLFPFSSRASSSPRRFATARTRALISAPTLAALFWAGCANTSRC